MDFFDKNTYRTDVQAESILTLEKSLQLSVCRYTKNAFSDAELQPNINSWGEYGSNLPGQSGSHTELLPQVIKHSEREARMTQAQKTLF